MIRVWRLTSVWLSVAYIGPRSRTERPRKTKIGTEVGHVTRDSDTTFTVQRSKVNLQRVEHIVEASHTACYIYFYSFLFFFLVFYGITMSSVFYVYTVIWAELPGINLTTMMMIYAPVFLTATQTTLIHQSICINTTHIAASHFHSLYNGAPKK